MSSVQRVSHIGICVSDLERSIRFYRDGLGFTPVHELHVTGDPSDRLLRLRGVDLSAVFLERDGVRIELLAYASPASPAPPRARAMNDLGFTHLSVIVDDVAAELARLEKAGGTALADTTIEVGGRAVAAMVLDPDGAPVELIVRDPTARRDPA